MPRFFFILPAALLLLSSCLSPGGRSSQSSHPASYDVLNDHMDEIESDFLY